MADDEVKMVRALRDFLSAHGFYVYEAYDGERALELYYEHSTKIDLLLLDVMMPKVDGFEVLNELRQNHILTPVIMVTARGEDYDQLRGFESGADDYVTKPFSPTLLMARIESVLRRVGKSVDSELYLGNMKIDNARRSVHLSGREIELTKREFDLLFFFASNENRILTREQLLNGVWGYNFEGDIRTVDTHVKQLRIKLGEDSSSIKTVYGVGYKLEVSP